MLVQVKLQCSTTPFEQIGKDDPLCMRKELIYEGRHKDGNGRMFTVTPGTIRYWVQTFNELNKEGIAIPGTKVNENGEHNVDPENRRGTWLAFSEGRRPDGKANLIATVKFKDEESKNALKDGDVSIYAENNYTGNDGKAYNTAITHVAFTDYPAIPGLSKFIACSRIEDMTLLEFAQSIQLVGEEATEEEAVAALKDALVKTAEAAEGDGTEDPEKEKELEAAGGDGTEDPEKKKEEIPASVCKEIAAGRKARLGLLCSKLEPKHLKELEKEYATPDRVKRDLKHNNKEFDALVIQCSKLPDNPKLPGIAASRTSAQNQGDRSVSPLSANAKRRAEEAKR